jgi:hypothetical protein
MHCRLEYEIYTYAFYSYLVILIATYFDTLEIPH